MEGLVGAVHDDGLVDHASVDVEHGEHHIEMDERLGLQRQFLEDEVFHTGFGLQMFDDGFHTHACWCVNPNRRLPRRRG